MSQAPQIDVKKLWEWVTAQVKTKTTAPGLWRSMEAARPITVEGDEVVLGFGPDQSHMRGLLLDNRHQRMIEQLMETGTKRRLTLRIIDGETLADWETHKANEREAVRLIQAGRTGGASSPGGAPGPAASGANGTWEEIGEKLIRRIGTIPTRAMPSVQGRLLVEAVDALVEAYPRLMTENSTEQDERSLSRTLDRLAERLGTTSATIGYFLHDRLRGG